jgi:hypothetical protein
MQVRTEEYTTRAGCRSKDGFWTRIGAASVIECPTGREEGVKILNGMQVLWKIEEELCGKCIQHIVQEKEL